MLEYGWAFKSLGEYQIIAVMNEAYGKPTVESLPFHLGHFRFAITYDLPDKSSVEMRREIRDQLAKKLEKAIRDVLESDEFKAKMPKPPISALFRQRPSVLGSKSRFREPKAPLGSTSDPVARLMNLPAEMNVFLSEGPTMWFPNRIYK